MLKCRVTYEPPIGRSIPFERFEKLFPAFEFYEQKGFNDKQLMISLVTWLTAFSIGLIGFWGTKYFGSEPFPRSTAIAACLSAVGLSAYTCYIICEFLNHAEINYKKVDKIIRSVGG